MKVKIGDTIHDPDSEPIMLIFESKKEQSTFGQQIMNMGSGCTKYCIYPSGTDHEEIVKFMEADK